MPLQGVRERNYTPVNVNASLHSSQLTVDTHGIGVVEVLPGVNRRLIV